MTFSGWLATRWARRRWVAALPVVLLVAVGATGATLALSSAQRTATAYDDYLARADVGDVVVNPSFNTREIDDVVRSLPNVVQATSAAIFSVTFDDGEPRSRIDVAAGGNVWGSHDGRYGDMDRPVVQSGRLAVGPSEAVVNVETARARGITVGDTLPIAFWQQGVTEGLPPDVSAQRAQEVIRPIGVEHVEVVGIVTLPDEVLPDDLSPRDRVIVSPDIAARYDCLPDTPTRPGTFAEVAARFLPDDCAVAYRYYSLSLAGGGADVKATVDDLVRQTTVMNEQLVALVTDLGGTEPPSYFVVPTETAQERDRIEHSNQPTVAALVALGLAAAVMTVALVGLVSARDLRRTRAEQRQWHQLGVSLPVRVQVIGAPLVAAVAVGLLLALVAGWALNIGPVGLVRVLEPHADRRLRGVGLAALAGIGLAAIVIIAALATRSARRAQASASTITAPRPRRRLAVSLPSPALTDGVRAAYRQPSAGPAVAGIAVLVAAFMAATVFGASLSALTSTPRLYGWPWDVAAMTGAGYGDLDLDGAHTALDDDPDVEGWTALGFLTAVSLDGRPMTAIVSLDDISAVDLTVRSGRLPSARDEVAIGETTARDSGLEVGDRVEIGSPFGPQRAVVTGIVVFPAIGPLFSDRVGTGSGLLLPQAMIEAAGDPQLGQTAADVATFIGVDVRDGDDVPMTIARIEAELGPLDVLGAPALTYPTPVRPPDIIDARSTRTIPAGVGIVFAVGAAIGLGFASWASVRSRRRHLAVLQTLGFTPVQVRRSVRAQSLTTVLSALVIGVPIGVVGGRALWRLFADQLGVVADPAASWTPIVLAAVGGCVLALAAAQVPALVASRSRPAVGLRAE